ncbi:MAG: hypothetical protein HWN81_21105, partial [Candidatus Lokiarchaeota archaeon]|nr:hypothetical protein [Candidatus Lokiarchaeota archaeon]
WSNNPKVIIGKEIGNQALKNKSTTEQRKNAREKLAKSVFNQNFYEK